MEEWSFNFARFVEGYALQDGAMQKVCHFSVCRPDQQPVSKTQSSGSAGSLAGYQQYRQHAEQCGLSLQWNGRPLIKSGLTKVSKA